MSTEVRAWFTGRLPDEWFAEPAEVTTYAGQISVESRPGDTVVRVRLPFGGARGAQAPLDGR